MGLYGEDVQELIEYLAVLAEISKSGVVVNREVLKVMNEINERLGIEVEFDDK